MPSTKMRFAKLMLFATLVTSSFALQLNQREDSKEIQDEAEKEPKKMQTFNRTDGDAFVLKEDQVATTSWDKQEIMIETEINADYVNSGLFDNWFLYAKPFLNASMHLIFDASDDEAKTYISNFNFHGVRHSFIDDVFGSGLYRDPYGSKVFATVTKRRAFNLKRILGRGYVAMHVDLDTVWMKNPFDIFDSLGKHDLLISSDGNDDYLCTCLLYLQPSKGAQAFVTEWMAEITEQDKEDQIPANRAIHSARAGAYTLDMAQLPGDEFPPGNRHSKSPTIYHANYRVGTKAKVDFFKDHGLWSVDVLPQQRRPPMAAVLITGNSSLSAAAGPPM
jgi:hypothetical protein